MKTFIALILSAFTLGVVTDAMGQGKTRLANICRLKGQEENVLRGVGLVVGLNGTGEASDPATMRALSRALELMGNPVSTTGRFDQDAQLALRKVKNVALVMVTAKIPPTGSRSGDKVDCTVSALNGKSLVGGRLISAALQGPNTQDPTVFALCEGSVQIDDESQPMAGNIHNGCQITRDVYTPFVSEDGWITIIIDPQHADFRVTEAVADQLANKYGEDYLPSGSNLSYEKIREQLVLAKDATNIRIKVPEKLEYDPVGFVAELLDMQIYGAEPEARVVCNTRTGSVVIAGDVEIGEVIFTHSNLVIQTGPAAGSAGGFQAISASASQRPKLDRLIEALSTLRVPGEDVIEIIRSIDRLGKLHAKLIVL